MPMAFKSVEFARLKPPAWGNEESSILRSGESHYARSPYSLEYNPWMSREDWETLLLLRGVIVAAFGQVETTLGELAIRLSRDERCEALRMQYPHAIDKRLKFLRECFKLEPYRRRARLAEKIFIRFEGSSSLRHVMAHGRILSPTMGWLTFRDLKPSAPGQILLRDHRFTIHDLEHHAYSAALLARRVQYLAVRSDDSQFFPNI